MKPKTETKTILEVYDPAMCCSTGVCGPDVDDALADFANDVKWLKAQGIEVKRFNLGQEPEVFKANPLVLARLKNEGSDILPLIFVNDELLSVGGYPDRQQLTEWLGMNPEPGFEKQNSSPEISELLLALEMAVEKGNENEMAVLFQKGKNGAISIQQLINAMQTGIYRRQQMTQSIVRTANELLGVPSNGCAPGSGCC
ncbi:MAG: arsenite efflux transporter metallochaperone ArsD [Balneolaceae bacterium]